MRGRSVQASAGQREAFLGPPLDDLGTGGVLHVLDEGARDPGVDGLLLRIHIDVVVGDD